MTIKSGLCFKLAAVMVAIVVFFLPEEFFVYFWVEFIQLCGSVNTVVTMTGLEFIESCLNFFRNYLKRVGRFILAHQIIGLGDKTIDGLLLLLIIKLGLVAAIIIIVAIYFVFYSIVIKVYDYFLDNGQDILELENLKESCNDPDSNKILRWILKRRTTIFLVGSCVQLDPDGVTILLRKDRKDFWGNAVKIMLPSIVVAVVCWGGLIKLGLMGINLFGWF